MQKDKIVVMQTDVNLVVIHFPMLLLLLLFFGGAIWYLVNMIHTLAALGKNGNRIINC